MVVHRFDHYNQFQLNKMKKITAVFAMDDNRGIGVSGELPWHIPEDLKHFKEVTKNGVMIMGRNTWDSLPCKPLSNRISIVVTSTPILGVEGLKGVYCTNSVGKALRLSELLAVQEVFIIGGAKIFDSVKDIVNSLIVTEVKGEYECDTFIPEFPGTWEEDKSYRRDSATKQYELSYRRYLRTK